MEILNELQDRAMAGDVNAQEDLDTLLAFQQEEPTNERSCTCGSGHTWVNCNGLDEDTSWCG